MKFVYAGLGFLAMAVLLIWGLNKAADWLQLPH